MMTWTVAEIAEAAGATVLGDAANGALRVAGATQDSRSVAPGMLFVPLVAERDGHHFIGAAVAGGARAYLTSQGRVDGVEAAAIAVDDTAAALTRLGSAARARLDGAAVIAITGSVGKTTTKDLVASILRADRLTHASERSFNNEIGVPLTLLAAPEDCAAVVIEMGSRGKGHIAALCKVARPAIGVVTTVGAAHTSEFGSLAGVVEAKGELVECLPAAADGGVAVLNSDVAAVASMADRTQAGVEWFSPRPGGRGGPLAVSLDDELRPTLRLALSSGERDARLGVRGAHLVANAMAAVTVAMALGVKDDAIVAGLAQPLLSPMRMALHRTASGARVIDDSYNANPMSIEGALRSLAALEADRRRAVLGVMAELGEMHEAEHARVAALAADLGIEVIAVDSKAYGAGAVHVDDAEAAYAALIDAGAPGEGDVVLVKGSRVATLERLVDRLVEP